MIVMTNIEVTSNIFARSLIMPTSMKHVPELAGLVKRGDSHTLVSQVASSCGAVANPCVFTELKCSFER
jgi:hypothetical protein